MMAVEQVCPHRLVVQDISLSRRQQSIGLSYPRFQTSSGLQRGLGLKITAMASENKPKNPRILCFHGFRTSGLILHSVIGKWPDSILRTLDLDFLDGPFPATGKSDVARLFDPPYYEWYQASKGAFLTAAIPGMQEKGTALTKVPKVKFLVIISGAKIPGLVFGQPKLAAGAFSSPVRCPSLHFIGERDYLKTHCEVLTESFVEPVVIHHSGGHAIPKLDAKAEETVLSFFQKIRQMLSDESGSSIRSLM